MYCKYCGKQIDYDSLFCKHCGRNIVDKELGMMPIPKEFNITPIIQNVIKWKNSVWTFLRPKFLFIWKVIKTLEIVIEGIVLYTFVGFFMSPFMALFNADMPSFGIFSQIEDIWKKEENAQKMIKTEDSTKQKEEVSLHQIPNETLNKPIVPPSPSLPYDDDLPF